MNDFDFSADPFENFKFSLRQAELKSKELKVSDFNAMTLASSENNKPSIRIVLFKGLVDRGFSFYSHFDGRKGIEISSNPNVALNFFWPYLNHQISVKGIVKQLSTADSDSYFQSRPRLSQIGAWASEQSQVLKKRKDFDDRIKYFEEKFKNNVVPRPAEWGGFNVQPLEIEFWFSREGRLHERYVYQRTEVSHDWTRFMRYP